MAITTNTANTTVTDRTASGNQPDNTPATGTTTGGSGGSGVTQIVAGTNVTISPSGGTGVVTVNSTAGGGGTVTSVASGTGLTGGPITTSGTLSIASTGVSAASYGTASSVPTIAVNTQGQITSASNTSIAISGGAVSGNIAGNAANVTGTVAIGNGGTGATTAATARTNLGLGTVATQTAPSGTSSQLLANNGSGGFNNVTVGTGLSYSGGTLTSSSSGGTVTSVGTAGSVNGITLTGGPITTSGTVTLGGTLGSIANSQLSNSSITVTAGTGLSGGGAVSLGGTTTLTNAGVTSVAGAGTVSVSASTGNVTITGSGFSNPMSALGDTIYGGSSPAGTPTRLAGNTAGVVKYLAQSGTGSVSSSPAWLQSYVYNVKDYGCVGNWDPIAGTGSDDTSAFQNCITAALSAASGTSQATVYIPAGSYKVTSDLIASGTTFSGNIAFKGDGWKVSKIIYTGTGTCLNLQASTSGYTYKNTVTVSGIGFIADNTSAASCALNVFYTTSTVPNSSAGEDSPIVSLSDIAVGVVITGEYTYHIANAGFVNGIKLHNVCQSHVTNLYLMGNTTHYGSASSVGAGDGGAGSGRGLWCTGTINIMYMNIDVRFWGQAIYLDSTSDASSQGNFFTNVNGVSNCEFFTTYAASGLQQVFAFSLVNFQSDNGASDTGVANPSYVRGVVINSLAYGSSISNGLILISVPVGGVSFGKPAILINGAQQVFISNVKAYDASNATSAYYGCYITGASSHVNISNCFLQGGGSSVGLYIDSGCNNNTAVGNSLINGYSDNGSGNQIGYNAS